MRVCVYVCMRVYVCVCMCVCTLCVGVHVLCVYMCMCVYVYVCMCVCVNVRARASMHACLYVRMRVQYTSISLSECFSVCMYVCLYVCVHVCVCMRAELVERVVPVRAQVAFSLEGEDTDTTPPLKHVVQLSLKVPVLSTSA